MKINSSGYNQYIEKLYKENKQTINKAKEEKETSNEDRIELSDSSKKIKKYIDQIKDSKINLERVETIKSAISSGTYRVSSEELAEKIVQKIKGQL